MVEARLDAVSKGEEKVPFAQPWHPGYRSGKLLRHPKVSATPSSSARHLGRVQIAAA
jgi:hypothetical protein